MPRALPEGRQHPGHVEAVQHLLQLLTAFFSQGVACSPGRERRVRVGAAARAPAPRPRPYLPLRSSFSSSALSATASATARAASLLISQNDKFSSYKQKEGVVAGRDVGRETRAHSEASISPRECETGFTLQLSKMTPTIQTTLFTQQHTRYSPRCILKMSKLRF